MMSSTSHELVGVLIEQIRCAEAMLDALERENRALTQSDSQDLGAATAAKTKLVETLETLEAQRAALSASVGNEARTATEWQRLRTLIAECKARNDKNGMLLKARADNVRSVLKSLRGAEHELYGRKGIAPSRGDARPLGKA
jgi:flagellar biosynthesis/type III secretory pathway chaperone